MPEPVTPLTKLNDIPPYTLDDWARERAADTPDTPLPCPNCGHAEWYHPLEVARDDHTWRQYRACKVCGCWQEADGESKANRCLLTAHTCERPIQEHARCPNCTLGGPHT